VAEQAIRLVRVVTAFGKAPYEAQVYDQRLLKGYKAGVRQADALGLLIGSGFFVVLSAASLALWYGGRLVQQGEMSAGSVVTVFLSVVFAAIELAAVGPAVSALTKAQGAAPFLLYTVDRQSLIDPCDQETGERLPKTVQSAVGRSVQFRNVGFAYPTRPTDQVLTDFNFTIDAGTTVALVGASGSGKSTVAKLLERIYDPSEGEVVCDGKRLTDLNVAAWRSEIGYVSQQPALFAVSIYENIAMGYLASSNGVEPTKEQVEDAARAANAHEFIRSLPNGYKTVIGERGERLSGGQKQRIAIARAIIRNPSILILDEATSALDTTNERIVQEALNKIQRGRTVLVIAHRLSAIRMADEIVVLERGQVTARGSHTDLVSKGAGFYFEQVQLQSGAAGDTRSALTSLSEVDLGKPSTDDGAQDDMLKEDGTTGMETEESKKSDSWVLWRLFKLSKPGMRWLLVGFLFALGFGTVIPVVALLFAQVVGGLIAEDVVDEISKWCLYLFIAAIGAFVVLFCSLATMGRSANNYIYQTRLRSFQALLKQDSSYFDHPDNTPGALVTRLQIESGRIADSFETFFNVVSIPITLVVGLVVAFLGCSLLTLVILVCLLIPILGIVVQARLTSRFERLEQEGTASAGRIASETMDNLVTVLPLGAERLQTEKYQNALDDPFKQSMRLAVVAGVFQGLVALFNIVIFGACIWVGSSFLFDGRCDVSGLFRAINGVIFAGGSLGSISSAVPTIVAARVATAKIFRLLDSEPSIDNGRGIKPGIDESNTCSAMGLEGVSFQYPSRPSITVLGDELELDIPAGSTVGLVGKSGSGKSTVIALLERFYDPTKGTVTFDQERVRDLEVESLRTHISLVSQEPELFNRSIRENIAYGVTTEEDDDWIVHCAKLANADSFIQALPDGYDTVVGDRGSQLSGGQRQRVAIARAFARRPRVLLLDEATSALDSTTEAMVQEAMKEKKQTVVVVAHRLGTVANADCIMVFEDGQIVERGSPAELVALNGIYASMVSSPS